MMRLNALGDPAPRWEDLPWWQLPLLAVKVFGLFTFCHVFGLIMNGTPNPIWKGQI